MVHTERIKVQTAGDADVHDINAEVARCVAQSGVRDGIVTVFVIGSPPRSRRRNPSPACSRTI